MQSKKLEKNTCSQSWNIGDFAWFVPFGEKRPQQGEITRLIENIEDPCATLMMVIDQKYRTALISSLCETSAAAKKLFQS